MELLEEDIKRIERLGYNRREFVRYVDGVPRLRNVDGRCVFLGGNGLCRIYPYRPLGCRIYPVVTDGRRIYIDDICPARHTIDKREFRGRAAALRHMVKRLLDEWGAKKNVG